MVKLNYSVSAGIMEFPDGKCIEVGLAQWWDWIESEKAKSFRFECDHGVKSYTARKERVKDLEVWYAYKSVGGKLRKRYIGKSDQLTQERLEIVAYDLEKEPQSRQKPQTLHSELGNEVGEYRELLNESRRIAVQRESDFERLLAQKIQLQEELKRLNDVLVNRDRNFEEATQQIAKLKRQLEKTTLALPSELGNSEAETLRAEIKRLAQERSALDQRIDELEEKTGDLGLSVQLKDEEIVNLKQQLLHNEVGNSEVAEAIAKKKKEAELEQSNSANKEEIRRLNAELRLVKQQREDFRSKWERAKEDNGNLFRELKDASNELLNRPDPAAILNRLRKERKNSKADLKDIELILELMQAISL